MELYDISNQIILPMLEYFINQGINNRLIITSKCDPEYINNLYFGLNKKFDLFLNTDVNSIKGYPFLRFGGCFLGGMSVKDDIIELSFSYDFIETSNSFPEILYKIRNNKIDIILE